MKIIICLLVLCVGSFVHAREAPVILLGIDGFRWDYLERFPTPHMNRVATRGFRVERMEPCQPTMSFPNLLSLVTGIRPGHHGLTGNYVYDEETGKVWLGKGKPGWLASEWYGANAIWEVAEQHGIKAACYYWFGSETIGRQPSITFHYRDKQPAETILSRVSGWLKDPEGPGLIVLYLVDTDTMAHRCGIDSPELAKAVTAADDFVGSLMTLIDDGASAHLVVVSDHGMSPLAAGQDLAEIKKVFNEGEVLAGMNNRGQLDLFVKDPTAERVDEMITRLPQKPYLQWYSRDDAPFVTHPTRSGHIIGISDAPYIFWEGAHIRTTGHGFTPQTPEMGAICFGIGPKLVAGSKKARLSTVDVFPLLLHLLGLDQIPVDGTLSAWNGILAGQSDSHVP